MQSKVVSVVLSREKRGKEDKEDSTHTQFPSKIVARLDGEMGTKRKY